MNPPSNPKNHDATPSAIQNDQINQTTTSSTKDSSPTYDRKIAHAAEIKFINDRYVTPITVKFGNSDSDRSVNLPVKHRNYSPPSKFSIPPYPSRSITQLSTTQDNSQWELHTPKISTSLSTRNLVTPASLFTTTSTQNSN